MKNKILKAIETLIIISNLVCTPYHQTNVYTTQLNLSSDVLKSLIQTLNDCTNKIKNCKYTEEELYIMSHVIYGEAGCYPDKLQLYVGSVVLNRVKSKRYPNTIKSVVFQKGQYACTWDGNYDKIPDERTIKNAKYLLEHGSVLPEYVIFQAGFNQGDKVYAVVNNVKFCYYTNDMKAIVDKKD